MALDHDVDADLLTLERLDRLTEIRGETVILFESSSFRRWYFSYTNRAVYIASLIPLATLRHADGRTAVCIPDSQIDKAAASAEQYGVTLQFCPVSDIRKDTNV